ncbi:assimilatory sulfite reductase (NADPH) flavoprotein subunit [Aquibacillus koreensis]|uniref:assimilatory sulfite reductase (NADPH) n=1 Tax=Aquibacillus koreensis TaxID=279446 RepID=A0A9X3WLL1_9BACI|nr:assimilatory sulfite reductase (NADPH) flavoprotein subunit [Aquibacillus koreensis]MCT2536929.1 assimilatory sulfite reductase (NADPH) flavoprotein subunit [Aquibacillus koreensis]MDC3421940.1 assimilatory sulfite reductase (NADPH) flavoprotein subunit [Aquibacillus koreensis]
MQLQVMNSPFTGEQIELLNRLLPTLSDNQKVWLSGYIAAGSITSNNQISTAIQATIQSDETDVTSDQLTTREITILYATDTGNSQALAEEFGQKLESQSFKVTVRMMDDFKPKQLKNVQDLFIVTSTHGDGDPPDNALSFYEFICSNKAPKLEDVRFSVLALGDSSYEYFCQTGKQFDERLAELGAERLHPRVDCDLDYEELAEGWFDAILSKVTEKSTVNNQRPSTSSNKEMDGDQPSHSKKHPFRAKILENLVLNGRGSNKETRHIELDIEGSNLTFEPGDSLGIIPENDPDLVMNIIEETGWNPDESVPVSKSGDVLSLREALTTTFEITTLTIPLLEKAAELSTNETLKQMVLTQNKENLLAYMNGRDLLDLIRDFGPWKVTAVDFIKILRKIPARLYSIASSSKANPDEVHLTIGTVRYQTHSRDRVGVCSGQFAERLEPGDYVPIYVQKNNNFRLPSNPETPIIMVGAGTGVATYRAFLEECEEQASTCKTWLFFGEQHFLTDFLYQVEWNKWLKEGVLSKMDVAFSRDHEEKVYVQNRMLEKKKELYQWLEQGANLYVCGDEKNMAKDVQKVLLSIIETEGNKTAQEAEAYLSEMRKNKRYQRDVY